MIGAATVLLLGAAAYAWSLAAGEKSGGPAQAQPQASVVAASNKCVLSYAVYSQTKDRFEATVTIANRDRTTIKNWNLWFLMQGDQVVKPKASGSFQLDQQGRQVNVTSNAVLDAKRTVTLDITGRFAKSNSAPLVFQLGDQKCETYVSSAPGQPSRQVQQLSNGQIRLGPPITTPRPGLNITPGGVIVPVPGPVDSSDPSETGSTVPGPGPTATTVTDDPSGATSEPPLVCPGDPLCPPVPDPEDSPSGGDNGGGNGTATPPDSQPPTTIPTDDQDQGDDTTGGSGGTSGETTSEESGTPTLIPPPGP